MFNSGVLTLRKWTESSILSSIPAFSDVCVHVDGPHSKTLGGQRSVRLLAGYAESYEKSIL